MASAAKPRVLFLCTGNSCRSQMAEGWARALRQDFDALSAGTRPQPLNPLAVRAMTEVGIDISTHVSKLADSVAKPDLVVTVCDAARESCPAMPGVRTLHAPFDDPPHLARAATSDDEAMPYYRRVRDEIRRFILTLDPHRKGAPMSNSSAAKSACCAPGCCTPAPSTAAAADDALRQHVREGYSKIAQAGSWSAASCCGPTSTKAGGGCCGPATFTPDQLASAIGYSQGELAVAPDGANMGLSCGNPTALASLKPGETVLDLGSGGGFDCFITGAKVGATGKVIGVDMTPDMITKARRNTAAYASRTSLSNVEFRLGEIENLPVADSSVDVVLSNCVLNLSPDKPRVWQEIARVLKPGGRVAVSDLALLRPLPESVRQDIEALVGCIAGAVLVEDTRRQMADAGLSKITLTPKPQYIEALVTWEDPLYRKIIEALPPGTKPADFITSLDISAVKP